MKETLLDQSKEFEESLKVLEKRNDLNKESSTSLLKGENSFENNFEYNLT